MEYLFRGERTKTVLLAGQDRDICCLETAQEIARSKRKVVTSLDLLASSGIISEEKAQRKYNKLGTLYPSTDDLIAAVRMEAQA